MLDSIDIWQLINKAKGRIFTVEFKRKNDRVIKGIVVAKKGDIKKMICRRLVSRFVVGPNDGKTEDIDFMTDTCTVFDVGLYNKLRKEYIKNGYNKEDASNAAGPQCYRRINLKGIIKSSLIQK